MQFRRFQTRILFLFIGLFIPVQAFTFLSVNRANLNNAVSQIEKELTVAGTVFKKLIEGRQIQLTTNARLLSADFALKNAVATGDTGTIHSVATNHSRRMDADMMMLAAEDDELSLLASVSNLPKSLSISSHIQSISGPFPFPDLVDEVYEDNRSAAAGLRLIRDVPFFVVVTPLLAPEPIAWICTGFMIDDGTAAELENITDTQVTFLIRRGGLKVQASTLSDALQTELKAMLGAGEVLPNISRVVQMAGERYVTLELPVGQKEQQVTVVLQRSLDEKLVPFESLRLTLALVSVAGLLVVVLGAVFVARSVSRPVHKLVDGARLIQQGDFEQTVEINQADEIGELATAFNKMTHGLAERDRVRGLLGKVVSPEVAEELLKNHSVQLGGEDLEVTILFSDIRSFTTLSETKSPGDILEFLNHYLTHMSGAIEKHGGVVDKYVGDAIMALFGAPIAQPDAPDRAMKSALAMRDALIEVNREFRSRGWDEIKIGIGINTDIVVAGNMGSPNRLNYTVIGDGVNLASRLEGLTKEYGVPIIVSEATLERAQGKYHTRSLGEVAVRGRTQPTQIYSLEGTEDD